MLGPRYFCSGYFARRYWPRGGTAILGYLCGTVSVCARLGGNLAAFGRLGGVVDADARLGGSVSRAGCD